MTDDELDRALFALPLATPPSGLRDRIVTLAREMTPLREAVPVRTLVLGTGDTAFIAVALAIATWLVLSGFAVRAVASLGTLASVTESFVERSGGETSPLLWLAVGASVAVAVTYGPRFGSPLRP